MHKQNKAIEYKHKLPLREAYKIHGNDYFKLVSVIGNYTYSQIHIAIKEDKHLKRRAY